GLGSGDLGLEFVTTLELAVELLGDGGVAVLELALDLREPLAARGQRPARVAAGSLHLLDRAGAVGQQILPAALGWDRQIGGLEPGRVALVQPATGGVDQVRARQQPPATGEPADPIGRVLGAYRPAVPDRVALDVGPVELEGVVEKIDHV